MGAKLKVSQPLGLVEIVLADPAHKEWLADHAALIREELNVKRVEFAAAADHYITYTVLPDLKRLGPRLGKRLPALRQAIAQADGGQLLATLSAEGNVTLPLADGPVTLDAEDLQVRLKAKEGWAAAQGRSSVVVVSTDLTPELVSEGLAREVVHAIQNCRKEMNCQYTDRIRVVLATTSPELHAAVDSHLQYVMQETLSVELNSNVLTEADSEADAFGKPFGGAIEKFYQFDLKIAGHDVTLGIGVTGTGSE
jgi:isoleucyl-tRNA synthetase